MDYSSYVSLRTIEEKEKFLSEVDYTTKYEIAESLCSDITILFTRHNRSKCFEFCDLIKDRSLSFKILSYCVEYENKVDSVYPSKYIEYLKDYFLHDSCNLSTRLDIILYLIKCFSSIDKIDEINFFFSFVFNKYMSSSYDTFKNVYKFFQKNKQKNYVEISMEFIKLCIENIEKVELGILCSQTLLNEKINKEELYSLFSNCVEKITDYNKKADIFDLLYTYGNAEEQKVYREKIKELGQSENFVDNKQNVHSVDVTDLEKMLEELEKYRDDNLVFEDIEAKILTICEDYSQSKEITDLESKNKISDLLPRVKHSLSRIFLDNVKYCGKFTAQRIFLNIFSFIQKSEYKFELEKRCIEELTDMAYTCTTGHILKLINILTGFTDSIGITISFNEEINMLIQKKIRELILESENSDDILCELTIDSLHKPKYNLFYRENIVKVVNDIRNIYVPLYVKNEEFDMYTRNAIMKGN